jgi:hypothetical protein
MRAHNGAAMGLRTLSERPQGRLAHHLGSSFGFLSGTVTHSYMTWEIPLDLWLRLEQGSLRLLSRHDMRDGIHDRGDRADAATASQAGADR